MIKLSLKFKWIIIAGAILGAVLIYYGITYANSRKAIFQNTSQGDAFVKVKGVYVSVLLAKTDEEHTKGLSGKESLAKNSGMLFLFDIPDYYGIWMKDMKFAIDIIWISSDMKIISIHEETQPNSYPTVFQPDAPAQYILEVPADFVLSHDVKVGDEVSFLGVTR